ncbi:MAG: type II secretion system F family protein [Actinomycetes bacterium]
MTIALRAGVSTSNPAWPLACLAAGAVLLAVVITSRPSLTRTVVLSWLAQEVRVGAPRRTKQQPSRRLAVMLALVAGGAMLVVVPWPLAPLLALVATPALLGLAVASRHGHRSVVPVDPLLLDVLAAALGSGATGAQAVRCASSLAAAEHAQALAEVVHRLELGVDPERAWSAVREEPSLVVLARVMTRAATGGASPVPALLAESRHRRELRISEVRSRAGTVSSLATLPLGLCFLPAFLLLGVVPAIATLVGPVLAFLS